MKPMKRILILAVVTIMVAALAGLARPVFADGGIPFAADDGRWGPTTLDRLAVYCRKASVDVLGIGAQSQGLYLTTFSLAELTSGQTVVHDVALGTVTLYMDASPKFHYGYPILEAKEVSHITDVGTKYHVTWHGGPLGADANNVRFVKSFSCTYLPMALQ